MDTLSVSTYLTSDFSSIELISLKNPSILRSLASLQKFPRNSLPIRIKNRCWKTGRSRGYYRDFGLSRHVVREMAHEGALPGVIKASW